MASEPEQQRPEEEEEELEGEESADILEEDPACILSIVANDHDEIKGLYRRFKDPGLTQEQHRAVVTSMVKALGVHVYAEEEVLCPAFAKEIGERARDHALDVDASLKLLLADVEGLALAAGGAGLREKIDQLMTVFFEHMNEEEHLMPTLREALGPEALIELGGRFREAKASMPDGWVLSAAVQA